jgi:transcriptional regulator of arginine metabolism
MTSGKLARRSAIRALIAERPVATQEQLRRLLAERGHAITQATLSRDLAELGAVRRNGAYDLRDAPRTAPLLRELIRTIDDNGSLVVVHTASGAAQVVANVLDRARLAEVLGTIAGDDAIFIAPARRVPTSRLVRKIRQLSEN